MNDRQGPDLAELTAGVHALIPLMGHMELQVVDASRGRAAAEIPAEPNVNHFGAIYAGSLFTVAEMLGGIIGLNTFDLEGFVPIVSNLEIAFKRPATSRVRASTSLSEDEIARVESEARADGKAQFFLDTEVTDEAGTVVATTRGTYQVRRMG